MPVSTTTNDRLRAIMEQARHHRSACTIGDGALSSLHVPGAQKDVTSKGLLASIRAAFKSLLAALPEDAPGTGKERMAVLQDVTRLDQPSYYDVMSKLNIDWTEPVFPNAPYTQAHKAAMLGMLPVNFGHWDIRDRTGATVAHVAAEKGHLPGEFHEWGLSRGDGWTVAHEAAMSGHLPEGIAPEILGWADAYGKTVGQCLKDHHRLSKDSKIKTRMH